MVIPKNQNIKMETEDKLSGSDALEKMKEIIKEVNIAMMCTTQKNGQIHSRPMATAGVDDDGTIWFFTNDASDKIDEIENDKGICLCYSKPSDNTYACIKGHAKVTDNSQKEKEYWNPILKAWFPKGLDDPKMTMVKVRPFHGEMWDDSSSKMVNFFKIVRAAITGGEYDAGDHKELSL